MKTTDQRRAILIVLAFLAFGSCNADASPMDLIRPYIDRLLNRKYHVSYTFKLTTNSSEKDVNSGLEQITSDLETLGEAVGDLDLRVKHSLSTGVVRLDWKRYTATGIHTYPVFVVDIRWVCGGLGCYSVNNSHWENQTCRFFSEADYTISRTVDGSLVVFPALVNGNLSASSWVKQFLKDDNRVYFYDDISDINSLTSEPSLGYRVYANIKKYTDSCWTIFDNHQSSISVPFPPTTSSPLPAVLRLILE